MLNPDSQDLTRKIAYKWIWLGVSLCVMWYAAVQANKPSLSDIIDKLYHHTVLLSAIDQETGEAISTSIIWPEPDADYGYPKDISTQSLTETGQLTTKISWSGIGPIEIVINSDGYQSHSLIVDQQSDDAITIELTPVD